MNGGARSIPPNEQVEISNTLANAAIAGGINPQQAMAALDISPARFNYNMAAKDLWFDIVRAVHAGASGQAGDRCDAVARLVDVVRNGLPGNRDLIQLAYNLGNGVQAVANGQGSIFLSYSSQDWQNVDSLFDAIARQRPNLNVFQDHRSIGLGRNWLEVIRSAANNASVMACWLTNNYSNSAFCNYEIGLAESRGARIVPVLAESAAASGAPAYIASLQMIRPTTPLDFDAIALELINSL